ncbi:MAG: CHASE4 domain-containing protein [Luteolibacter sp.]
MSIRRRIYPTLLLAAAAALGFLLLILRFQLLPRVEALEEEEIKQEHQQLEALLGQSLARLDGIAVDWAFWDATYEFVEQPTESYRQDNLIPFWLERYEIELLLIESHSGGWTECLGELPGENSAARLLAAVKDAKAGSPQRGFAMLGGDTYMVATHPIRGSSGSKPSRGMVLVAKRLDLPWQQTLGELCGGSVSFDTGAGPAAIPAFKRLSRDQVAITTPLPVILPDQAGLSLRIVESRQLYSTLNSAIWVLIVGWCIGLIVLLVVIGGGLERSLVKPLLGLRRGMEKLAGTGLEKRVNETQREDGSDLLQQLHTYLEEAGRMVNEQKEMITQERDQQQRIARERALLIESRERELRNSMREALTAADGEAKRIGDFVHDHLCQDLVALSRNLESLEHTAGSINGDERKSLHQMSEHAGRLVGQARAIAHDLALPELQGESLTESLEALVARNRELWSCEIEMSLDHELDRWSQHHAEHLYRIIREALHNAYRHARAKRIWLDMIHEDEALVVSISNDGEPLKFPMLPGLGMRQIEMRSKLLNATFRLFSRESCDGCETVAELVVPLNAELEPATSA